MLFIGLDSSEALLCRAVADTHPEERREAALRLLAILRDMRAFDLAERNEVASMVAHPLMESDQADLSHCWRECHDSTHARVSMVLCELDQIAAQLADEGIILVALKNGGIARGIYPCPGCSPMGDLDVLVARRHFGMAHRLIEKEGYELASRSPAESLDIRSAEASGGAEYRKTLSDGTTIWFEVQWRPVAGRWIRPDQEPDGDDLLARSNAIPGSAVRLLSPEDNLLQVALHTAKHSYVRAPGFRLHTDVDRIVRRQVVDWGVFVQRVTNLQVRTAVYFALAIPFALFRTPIPEAVLARLKPPIWKEQLIRQWLRRAGLFNPNERKFSWLGYILFNALLYDDIRGLWRGIFPDQHWMRQRYGFRSNWLLPYYHSRRLLDLAFRRAPL